MIRDCTTWNVISLVVGIAFGAIFAYCFTKKSGQTYGKYSVRNGRLVNTKTGVAIPIYEPIFIVRAQDSIAVPILSEYVEEAERQRCLPSFMAEVQTIRQDFSAFRMACSRDVRRPD